MLEYKTSKFYNTDPECPLSSLTV